MFRSPLVNSMADTLLINLYSIWRTNLMQSGRIIEWVCNNHGKENKKHEKKEKRKKQNWLCEKILNETLLIHFRKAKQVYIERLSDGRNNRMCKNGFNILIIGCVIFRLSSVTLIIILTVPLKLGIDIKQAQLGCKSVEKSWRKSLG